MFGEPLTHGPQRRQRLGLVQRCQVSQLLKRTCDVVVDQHGTGEPLAAVDDPVRDRLDGAETVAQCRIELIRVHLCVGSVELTLGQDPVVIGDQAELQRA